MIRLVCVQVCYAHVLKRVLELSTDGETLEEKWNPATDIGNVVPLTFADSTPIMIKIDELPPELCTDTFMELLAGWSSGSDLISPDDGPQISPISDQADIRWELPSEADLARPRDQTDSQQDFVWD